MGVIAVRAFCGQAAASASSKSWDSPLRNDTGTASPLLSLPSQVIRLPAAFRVEQPSAGVLDCAQLALAVGMCCSRRIIVRKRTHCKPKMCQNLQETAPNSRFTETQCCSTFSHCFLTSVPLSCALTDQVKSTSQSRPFCGGHQCSGCSATSPNVNFQHLQHLQVKPAIPLSFVFLAGSRTLRDVRPAAWTAGHPPPRMVSLLTPGPTFDLMTCFWPSELERLLAKQTLSATTSVRKLGGDR